MDAESVSGLLDFAKLSPIAFLQLLLIGFAFVGWKFLNNFFEHNKEQSKLLNSMMQEIRSEFSCHRQFVATLKTDIHQEIAELGEKFDGMEKRVDDLSTAVARLELISDLLKK